MSSSLLQTLDVPVDLTHLNTCLAVVTWLLFLFPRSSCHTLQTKRPFHCSTFYLRNVYVLSIFILLYWYFYSVWVCVLHRRRQKHVCRLSEQRHVSHRVTTTSCIGSVQGEFTFKINAVPWLYVSVVLLKITFICVSVLLTDPKERISFSLRCRYN